MFISHYNGHGIKLVRPLSTVDHTRDYTLVYPTVDSGLTVTYSTLSQFISHRNIFDSIKVLLIQRLDET